MRNILAVVLVTSILYSSLAMAQSPSYEDMRRTIDDQKAEMQSLKDDTERQSNQLRNDMEMQRQYDETQAILDRGSERAAAERDKNCYRGTFVSNCR